MRKLLGWLGLLVGSTTGWALGARFGLMTGLFLSVIGTGVGLYLGRRIADTYL
jgi:hypothetical protein